MPKKLYFIVTKPENVQWFEDAEGPEAADLYHNYQRQVLDRYLNKPGDLLDIRIEDNGNKKYYGWVTDDEDANKIMQQFATDEKLIYYMAWSDEYYANNNVQIEVFQDDVKIL